MAQYPSHLIVSVVALAATLAVSSFSANRLVKRKLRLSVLLLGVYVLLHAVLLFRGDLLPVVGFDLYSIGRLVLAAGLINLLVVALVNPLREDRIPDRFPSIVQDALVIGLVLLVGTVFLGDTFLATSAVSAVVLGFALQDTLGNAFAGLAIQSEKPFNIGHWVRVGEFEGRVTEVTWRATKIRTKWGNFVIVPNNVVGKEAITNFSEPVAPTRLHVEIGLSYDAPPNDVKRVMREALGNCPLVLQAPPPDIIFANFGDFALIYRLRFWIHDPERDEEATDQVRTALFYALRRHNIEIPYPIQTEISAPPKARDPEAEAAERDRLIAGVDLFASFDEGQRRQVAAATRTLQFADGESIVREGDAGDSMYIVCSGAVAIMLRGAQQPVAVTEKGGYFGEMSLLTGDPRSASVVARGDVVLLEIGADVFRELAETHPHTIEQVGVAAATRRAELDGVRASAQAAAVVDAPKTLLTRMRRFLRMR